MNKTYSLDRLFSVVRSVLVVGILSVCAPAWALSLNGAGQKIVATSGAGQSTIVDLVENPDGTLSISAEQSGRLSHLGNFTGSFSYLATIDYNTGTTLLDGEGVIRLPEGELFVDVLIVEVGLDYPRPYTGFLLVKKGTGRFANARGLFEITGVDEESLTDDFILSGFLLTKS
ncbi:MAG: hypothetical protein QM760_14090 [Nibricoccus sp.]